MRQKISGDRARRCEGHHMLRLRRARVSRTGSKKGPAKMSRDPVEYFKIKPLRMRGLRRNQPHQYRYWLADDDGKLLFVLCSDMYVAGDQHETAKTKLRDLNFAV